MRSDAIFSARLLVVWIVAAVLMFALSLYFMGGGSNPGSDSVGPSTYSRSAIGYAGIADVLQKLNIPVVKSRSDSLGKIRTGGVMIIAEPRPDAKTEAALRTLLQAEAVLLVLPKWTGHPSQQRSSWIGEATLWPAAYVGEILHLVAPQSDLLQVDPAAWTSNVLNISPSLSAPMQLMRGGSLRPLVAGGNGMLLAQVPDRNRTVLVLADPDLISNHGFGQGDNAALAVAIINRLRTGSGNVVFDETIHGFVSEPANPLLLLFQFPFVMATIQAAIAITLLLWATIGRFGAPLPAEAPMSAGRQGLLQNIAKLIEFTGHREVMIRRYVLETVRDVALQLHAPRGLSNAALVGWLQRVGAARGMDIDCGALIADAESLSEGRRRSPAFLVRLARDIHKWREEIVDGRARHPRAR